MEWWLAVAAPGRDGHDEPDATRRTGWHGRRTVSIGEDLAEARRRAGLAVSEVSQRTRIRETIIRAIEEDDFAGCGADFYARGFIRAIARAVGADPAPLIRDYDAAHRSTPAVAPTELPWQAATVRRGSRRRLNVTAVLALALAIAVGFACYQLVSASAHAPGISAENAGKIASGRHHAVSPEAPSPPPYAHRVVVELTAIEDCWVEFTTTAGRLLFQSYVAAGASKRWTFRHAVDMQLGNPGGVKLIVNGSNPLPPGTSHPVTVRLGRSRTAG